METDLHNTGVYRQLYENSNMPLMLPYWNTEKKIKIDVDTEYTSFDKEI